MGEARRRKGAPAGAFEIKGPASYEVGAYRLDDILAGVAMALFGADRRPSAHALALMQATAQLAARMTDRRLPTMLCAFCDHEFTRGERPTEIMVALPWANPKPKKPPKGSSSTWTGSPPGAARGRKPGPSTTSTCIGICAMWFDWTRTGR